MVDSSSEFLLSIHDLHSFPLVSIDVHWISNDFQWILVAEQAAEPGCLARLLSQDAAGCRLQPAAAGC